MKHLVLTQGRTGSLNTGQVSIDGVLHQKSKGYLTIKLPLVCALVTLTGERDGIRLSRGTSCGSFALRNIHLLSFSSTARPTKGQRLAEDRRRVQRQDDARATG